MSETITLRLTEAEVQFVLEAIDIVLGHLEGAASWRQSAVEKASVLALADKFRVALARRDDLG